MTADYALLRDMGIHNRADYEDFMGSLCEVHDEPNCAKCTAPCARCGDDDLTTQLEASVAAVEAGRE